MKQYYEKHYNLEAHKNADYFIMIYSVLKSNRKK